MSMINVTIFDRDTPLAGVASRTSYEISDIDVVDVGCKSRERVI